MRILITGGVGFFGKAFAANALQMGHVVCIYSRNEYSQFLMRQEFKDHENLRWFIGDVRDIERLKRSMNGVETVIHAAALKRIEVGEYCPDELVKTNTVGAINVIEAAMQTGVKNVVALSTDKAAAPYNAYGASKLLSEKLFLAANNMSGVHGTKFAVVRYGNVSGSTGSVIPTWRKLLAEGKKLTITNPNMTRYWMDIQEAVDMVAASIGRRDMAIPSLAAYRVGDLAEAMGGEIEVTGLRPGEKMHETMVSEHEYHLFGIPGPMSSDTAPRLTVEELRERLKNV